MASESRGIQHPRELQLICGAMVFSNAVYVIVAAILGQVAGLPILEGPPLSPYLGHALVLLGLCSAGASFGLRSLLLRNLPGQPTLQQISGPVLLSTAMAEAAGILGLLVVLLTGAWLPAGLLWGIGIGAGILHYPSTSMLQDLQSGAPKDGAA